MDTSPCRIRLGCNPKLADDRHFRRDMGICTATEFVGGPAGTNVAEEEETCVKEEEYFEGVCRSILATSCNLTIDSFTHAVAYGPFSTPRILKILQDTEPSCSVCHYLFYGNPPYDLFMFCHLENESAMTNECK